MKRENFMQMLKMQWLSCSLKRKIVIIMALTLVLMTISESITMFFCIYTLDDFENVINNNSIYHELQSVMKEEQETFLLYIRNRSEENRQALETACLKSVKSIHALPFDYEELGEERYARTWNLLNGYDGYVVYRDALLSKSENDADYIELLYEVLSMQESLSDYALKLVQVTLEQWDDIYEEKMQLFRIVPFYILGIIFLMTFLIMKTWDLFAKTLIKPIILVAEESRKIAANNFDTPPIEVENQDEIGELVAAFHKMKQAMIAHIHTLEEKNRITELLHKEALEKVEIEKSLEQARFDILKHQVNPHFLFNTLNMISSMARLEDAEITDKMTVSLGNLFRYNLRTVEQEIFLEQEIEALDDYIYIQQMRFDNRIIYQKEIELDARSVKIPSFTLQPIVENAFVHGVSGKEQDGKILIKIWKEKNKLMIVVKDNGCGMDEKRLQEIQEKICEENISGKGIGLGNICKRIRMMYPEEGKFEICSIYGEGTTVHLEIPQK